MVPLLAAEQAMQPNVQLSIQPPVVVWLASPPQVCSYKTKSGFITK
jgi:hypothetical protein